MKSLFFTAYAQVLLVALNTWQITHEKWVGAMVVGFLISWVWTMNVRGVAASTRKARLIYCCGAALGTVSGIGVSQILYR